MQTIKEFYYYLFDSAHGSASHFVARWLFLRALGLIYLSAFFALLFQVRGLIGSQGILPAADYLHDISGMGALRFWYVPTLLWFSGGDHALMVLCWTGLVASLLLVVNVWPRAMLLVCFALFPLIRQRGTGLLRVPVGRHVAGSGLFIAVSRTVRNLPGFG